MKLTKQEIEFIVKNFDRVRTEYKPDLSVHSQESKATRLLERLWHLPEYEINLCILYSEVPSYRKVGDILGLSYGTVKNEIDKIRRKLLC